LDTLVKYAFFEDKIVPIAQAKISIMTHGFMYATSVFEGIRVYWNAKEKQMYILRLPEHLERMYDSMKIMHLQLKYSIADLTKIITDLLKAEKFERDAYIRITVYKSSQKIGVGLQNMPSDICIFVVPFDDYYEGKDGLHTCISNWRRVEDNAIPARAKIVGAYANSALCKADAILSGFDEAIVLSESGSVSEGSAMNLFLVKHGQLITPDGTQNILEGVTRATIMTLAQDNMNLTTACREVDRSELYIADELFFTGTGAQVKPILSVDKRPVGNGKPGPLTTKLMELYYSMAQGKIEKYKKWLLPVY
jgi:branched-chain amino acid aminotransferase